MNKMNAPLAAMSASSVGHILCRCSKVASGHWVRASLVALALMAFAGHALAAVPPASFVGAGSAFARAYVQKAYVAYYGRPADPEGQGYWASRMDAEGNSLDPVIAAFGTSDEFNRRYGGLPPEELVTKIYQQALNRGPDPAGLDFYLTELKAGRMTLQTITLAVLDGATTPPDSTTIANKLAVADYYTTWVENACAYGSEQVGVDALTAVTSDAATVAAAKAALDLRCGGISAVNPANIQDSYRLNELTFELPALLGKKVWVMGHYGNVKINGDGVGFLVDNPLRMEVNEVFPHHSFARLDGNLPPDDWQGDEVLVYGTVKDYAQTYGVSAVQPTPLITVIQIQRMQAAVRTNSWENTFLLGVPPAPAVSLATGRGAPAARVAAAAAGTGTKAQDCDRSVILSGGYDASNNHDRYRENIAAKFSKMKELGFTDAQIKVFYDDGGAIDPTGANVPTDKATKQKIKDHLSALASEMTGSCTLTLFVTDHGTGYNAEQGYGGARLALSGEDATGGKLYAENTFKIDARAKAYRSSSNFVLNGNSYFASKDAAGTVELYKRVGGSWAFLGANANGDTIISETEAKGEDFNADGDGTDATFGISIAYVEGRLGAIRYASNEWDADGDGVKDVRVRHDGTRFVVERLVGGIWQEMGRDTNADFMIDGTDGGVDWNLDGDKDDQVGFHEGINLWGKEVLWDDEFAAALLPLAEKGVHIMVEMVSCFSGGFVPELQGVVESIFANSAEDTKNYSRLGVDGKIHATDELAFLENLQGIDPESWAAAIAAAIKADDDAATAKGAPKNVHTQWQTKKYVTESVFRAEGNDEYTVQLDIPDELQGQVYDFEFILGLQKPRWTFVGFPQNLPAGLDSELVPGGIRVFGSQPIPDQTQIRIKVTGATVTDAIRIDYTDQAHHRLGYTMAMAGTIAPPATVTFAAPLVCIDHFNPNNPSSNSTIEWLFIWSWFGGFISSPDQIEVTVRVTVPGVGPTLVTKTLGEAFIFYLLFGINFTGSYPYEIVAVKDLGLAQMLSFNGSTAGSVNVMFPAEQNVGQCMPPP